MPPKGVTGLSLYSMGIFTIRVNVPHASTLDLTGFAHTLNAPLHNQGLSSLAARSLNYIIAAKAYANLKHEIYGLKDWVEICPGAAVKEWRHQPANPKARERRHIVVRKEVNRRPQAGGKLLFEDLPDYRFSIFVTNLDLPLDQIWNIYNTRADCENRIRELQQDFGLEAFCLKDFWATEASFRCIMVA
jgi:hypothetical protein